MPIVVAINKQDLLKRAEHRLSDFLFKKEKKFGRVLFLCLLVCWLFVYLFVCVCFCVCVLRVFACFGVCLRVFACVSAAHVAGEEQEGVDMDLIEQRWKDKFPEVNNEHQHEQGTNQNNPKQQTQP